MTWDKLTFELATPADSHLDAFDYTKLSAINMCPTWGIIRYAHHKTMPGGGRSMALEAGTVMHECFSAVRLVQLGHPKAQSLREHMQYHGERLFGIERWGAMLAGWDDTDLDSTTRSVALECLATGGYVDDPNDRRRTYVNLETAIMYYAQRWDHARYPIWVEDVNDPEKWVGVEIPFDVKVKAYALATNPPIREFRLTGRIDGLHHTRAGESDLLIQENKTASRLDQAWEMSFDMSHQVTGYAVAAGLFAGVPISRGLVLGLSLPLPRYATDGLKLVSVNRPDFMKARWMQWLEHTITIHDRYVNNLKDAPQHTHSCNRYFRPCSLIPYCASDDDERADMLSMMVNEEWSPLHEKSGD